MTSNKFSSSLLKAVKLLMQLASALHFIADRRVIHRDVKADNVLICSDALNGPFVAKLVDFGSSLLLPEGSIDL